MTTRYLSHPSERTSEHSTRPLPLATVGPGEWVRGLLPIGAIVLAVALVELPRHAPAIPARFLAAVAASTALALVALGAELAHRPRVALTILAATTAFSLACLASPHSPVFVLCASFAVQSLATGALALTGGTPRDHRGSLPWAWCFFHATVAASLAMGS